MAVAPAAPSSEPQRLARRSTPGAATFASSLQMFPQEDNPRSTLGACHLVPIATALVEPGS